MPKNETERDNLHGLLRRLTAVLAEETALLKANPYAQTAQITVTKNRCLFDINRLVEHGGAGLPGSLDRERVAALNTAVRANAHALSVTIDATRSLIGTLAEEIRAEASDGTYGATGYGSAL
jgi:hypothetical protein